MTGVFRFDCYPSDFLNGVMGLSADEIAAYFIVLMLLYDVPYAGREKELKFRTGLTSFRLNKAVSHLIELGKLSLVDGALTNHRAEQARKNPRESCKKSRKLGAWRGGKSPQIRTRPGGFGAKPR